MKTPTPLSKARPALLANSTHRSRSNQKTTRRVRDSRSALFPKRIVVPIDFSECSLRALQEAISVAKHSRAEVTLIHVVETYPIDYLIAMAETKDVNATLARSAQSRLDDLVAERLAPNGVLANAIVRWGKPSEEIVRTAKDLDADLIVLSTHGYTGWEHALLGSTAERVVQHSPCAVLTIRGPVKTTQENAPPETEPSTNCHRTE